MNCGSLAVNRRAQKTARQVAGKGPFLQISNDPSLQNGERPAIVMQESPSLMVRKSAVTAGVMLTFAQLYQRRLSPSKKLASCSRCMTLPSKVPLSIQLLFADTTPDAQLSFLSSILITTLTKLFMNDPLLLLTLSVWLLLKSEMAEVRESISLLLFSRANNVIRSTKRCIPQVPRRGSDYLLRHLIRPRYEARSCSSDE